MTSLRGGDGGGASSGSIHHDANNTSAASYDGFYNNPAHPNPLPSNVINAYSNNFDYTNHHQQQHQHSQQQHQQEQQSHHHLPPILPANEYDQMHHGDPSMYGNAGGGDQNQQHDHLQEEQVDPDATADYSINGLVNDAQQGTTDAGSPTEDDDDTLSSGRKKSKSNSGRVAKACQPCSSKKRRCDGAQPECSVCKVLGTPCTYNNTGLKRGPPKGFRSGPKESAKAKLTRILETTIRDLTMQLGVDEAKLELERVSRERGLADAVTDLAGRSFIQPHQPSTSEAVPAGSTTAVAAAAAANQFGVTEKAIETSLAADPDAFLSVNEGGDLLHRGSSSGIQLLRRTTATNASAGSPSSPSTNSPTTPGIALENSRGGNTSSNDPIVVPISSPVASTQSINRPQGAGSPRSSHEHRQSGASIHSNDLAATAAAIIDPSQTGALGYFDIMPDPIVTPEESHVLLTNYWRNFHPYWPILYKAVLDEIPHDQVAARLDGLLLNAIYAIGSSGRDTSDPRKKSSAHEVAPLSGEMFAQAAERRLYASGLRPTVSAIQASALLAIFAHGNGDLSRSWVFSGIAITMATDLGLHRWPFRMELLSNSAERETRTRLIWSLYILDKILCCEMGRSSLLRVAEMDPPLLSEDVPDEMEHMDGYPMRIASCFNAFSGLFSVIEHILSRVHSLRRKAVLRRAKSSAEILAELDAELQKWKRSVPPHLRIPTDGSRPKVGFPGVVWALGVWEATATMLLHRPFIPQGVEGEPPSMSEVMSNPSHQKAIAAADDLCRLLKLDVDEHKNEYPTHLYPSDYAYCLFTTAVMYLFDARINVPGAKRKFALCRNQIKKLSSRWPAASAHRQLLDGFTAVADDALGRPGPFTSPVSTHQETEYNAANIESWALQTAQTAQAAVVPSSANCAQVSTEQPQGVKTEQDANNAGLTEEQRQQLLEFYMTSTHRFGADQQPSRRQFDNFAPGLFDVETAFWNETAGASSSLSNAFGGMMAQGMQQGLFPAAAAAQGSTQQQQQQYGNRQAQGIGGQQQGSLLGSQRRSGGASGAGGSANSKARRGQQSHGGLAMLAALAPAVGHQSQSHGQGQQGQGGEGPVGVPIGSLAQLAAFQPVQQHLHAAQQQASPFAFGLDPGQPAWTDPIMGALDLGPAFSHQQHHHSGRGGGSGGGKR